MQHSSFSHARAARALIITVSLLALSATSASAAMKMGAATPPSRPSAAESAFVGSVSRALQTKFGDVHAAENAGYYRTTRLEPDGTIIYFNNQWNPTALTPNFLWYDKHGKLVGLDYQYLVAGHPKPPGGYAVAASRWTTIDAHIHYGYQLPDGTVVRKGYGMLPSMHGNVLTEAELRQAKLLPANAKLLWTYVHPKSWDLGFWLVPNPSGAFADMNPNVKP